MTDGMSREVTSHSTMRICNLPLAIANDVCPFQARIRISKSESSERLGLLCATPGSGLKHVKLLRVANKRGEPQLDTTLDPPFHHRSIFPSIQSTPAKPPPSLARKSHTRALQCCAILGCSAADQSGWTCPSECTCTKPTWRRREACARTHTHMGALHFHAILDPVR